MVDSRSVRKGSEKAETAKNHRGGASLQQGPDLKASDPVSATQTSRHSNKAKQNPADSDDPRQLRQDIHLFSSRLPVPHRDPTELL
jgi:hypothetical protein